MALRIRAVLPGEAGLLSDLALRSKAHWGYSQEFIAACRHELTFTPEQIIGNTLQFIAAETEGDLLGFYALEQVSATEFELQALFVEPRHIGSGVGRTLIAHAKCAVAQAGGKVLRIQGDPHAERFYRAAGGMLVGQKESASFPGRFLPMFAITFDAPATT